MAVTRTPAAVVSAQRRIGEQLATWRKLRQLTAAQVADRAGISRYTVMRLEGGEGARAGNLLRGARALGVPYAYAPAPSLPLVTGSLQTPVGRALFGAFSDCAPDRWGRALLARREAARAKEAGTAPRSLSEADVLLGVRDDLRQGA